MNGGNWYIRQYGKVTGPFPWERLRAMKAEGQLGSFSELSQDQQNWVNALQFFPPPPPLPKPKPKPAPAPGPSTVPENKTADMPLSSQGGHGPTMMGQVAEETLEPLPDSVPRPRPSGSGVQHAAPSSGGSWYYAVDEQQYGPVSFDQLRQMVARGTLRGSDMVWEQGGLDDWLPASSIPELGARPNHLIWIIPLGCFVLLLIAIGVISLIVWAVKK